MLLFELHVRLARMDQTLMTVLCWHR